MKNCKRALRREQKRNHIIRRVKIWHNVWSAQGKTYAEYLEEVFNGDRDLWMRTQNVPCSCFCCSGEHKYRRTRNEEKRKVAKEIEESLMEFEMQN
jgi:hypothetical protein